MENYNEKASTKGTISFVLGIIGILCFFYKAIFSIVFGILAIILGIMGKKESPKGKKAVSIIGIVLGVIDSIIPVAIIIFFTTTIWPSITSDVEMSTYCITAECDFRNQNCTYIDNQGRTVRNVDCSKYLNR